MGGMGWWTERVVPQLVERSLDVGPVHKRRASVCHELAGEVVELGFGSGLNLAHLPSAVTRILAVEPSDRAWAMAADRVAAQRVPVVRAGLDGARLDLPTGSADAVLTTFTLCTIPDLGAALSEARRVLRPGGRLHFLEHGLAPPGGVRQLQRILNPLERAVAGGCHLTRDIPAALRDAGFEIDGLTEGYAEGLASVSRPWSYLYAGVASPTAAD